MISDINRALLIEFAQAGFEFFPLVKPWGEKKLGEPKGWPSLATSDLATINSWLETSKYGFGMCFGSKRMFAFDLDVKEVDGIGNFKHAMDLYGIPSPSLIFKTPSGGRHLIYAYPPGISIKNVAGFSFDTGGVDAGTGIDIRAEGGYIGSFGARDNGYELIVGHPTDPLSVLPQAVIEKLPIKADAAALAASALAMTKSMVSMLERTDTKTSLYGVIPKIIYKGERDNTLFNLIASWVRSGIDKTCIMVLAEEAVRRCEGRTDDLDVASMVDRTITNPDFVFSKRSKALQLLLKNLVFLSDINRYITLHDKAIIVRSAVDVKFSTLIEAGSKANGDPKFLPLSTLWHGDDSKLVYRNYGYKPVSEDIYFDDVSNCKLVNTYVKPNIIPQQNDEIFDRFCNFAKVICDDGEKGMFLVEFFAYLIQKPAKKIGIAPVVISIKQGVGKNFFLKIITKLLGGKNVTQLYSDNIVNNFNSSIATSQLIVINESIGDQSSTFSAKSKNTQSMARLKSMITDYPQPIERKGQDIITMQTYTNFIFFSNDIAAVSFDSSDRRFYCIINDQPPMEKAFFDGMDILKTPEGLGAIQYGLANLECTRIHDNMTHTMKTRDDKEVLRHGLTGHEEEIYNDIDTAAYIFRSTFLSAQMFTWYCIHKFGMDMQRDKTFINRLRKEFFLPLYVSKEYRQAKQIKLETPDFYIAIRNNTDSIRIGGKEVHTIWYVKPNHNERPIYGENFDTEFLKKELSRCIDHFKSQLNTGDVKPELSLVQKSV